MLGETDFPSLPVPGSDIKSDFSDFGDCVTNKLLDLLTEPLSSETGVPGGNGVSLLPDFESELDDFTDFGEHTPILELLEVVCSVDTVTELAFCSSFGEDENFLLVEDCDSEFEDHFADKFLDFLEDV
jgi:hypothetical protein